MNGRRLVMAAGVFILAAALFVVRKRMADYKADERLFMSLAALCGLTAIFMLYRARKGPQP